MYNNIPKVPEPRNEPVYSYLPGSSERGEIKKMLKKMSHEKVEIPLIIGGKEIGTGAFGECIMPHNHGHSLGRFHKGGAEQVNMAIAAAVHAKRGWEAMPWDARAAIFLRAAELLSGEYRTILNSATMLSQSKTIHQAEIDSACELIDFFRFNTFYMAKIYGEQPVSGPGVWNSMEYRPLEGFVFAVTPFNFTAIAGNLPTSAAMMGNTVVWKPASTAVFSAYYIMQLLKKAGLPDGVINLVPGSGASVGDAALGHPELAGVHFTGSTPVFQSMWRTIGQNIERYKTYPRIVGETGGKNFVFAHSSASVRELVAALIRGAFEYQGQKCSAVSRAYIPGNLWEDVRLEIVEQASEIKVGDITDFTNFMGAVIDKAAFDRITEYIEYAKNSGEAEIIAGGTYSDSKGYFIEPTVIKTTNPYFKTMTEEIFGPVLTIYVYPEKEYSKVLGLCDSTSRYGLTGAIFASDREAVLEAMQALKNSAGNFYINDKPTGAVIGNQPFGGSRASGTNDKAGTPQNLLRWTSPRTIKEAFCPPKNYRYPFMEEK